MKLIGKLKYNRYMMIFEIIIAMVFLFLFMTLMVDYLHVRIPILLILTLIPLYIISSQVYIIKKRIRKSIEIYKTVKRNG